MTRTNTHRRIGGQARRSSENGVTHSVRRSSSAQSFRTMNDWFQTPDEATIPSPALVLFRERIEHNFRLMLEIAGGPARLRPHVKTHKLGPLVRRQIELGITKFKSA